MKVSALKKQNKDMTKDEILRKYEDGNEYHFHEVDRAWIMEAMEEYAEQQVKNNAVLPRVSGSNYCKQCGKEIDKQFRFCSGECKQYYYR